MNLATYGVRHVLRLPKVEPRAYLIDEEHPGDDGCLPLLPPLRNLEVDLLSHLALDLARVSREKRQEALLPRVDHVDLVQGYLRHVSTTNTKKTRTRRGGGDGRANRFSGGVGEGTLCMTNRRTDQHGEWLGYTKYHTLSTSYIGERG